MKGVLDPGSDASVFGQSGGSRRRDPLCAVISFTLAKLTLGRSRETAEAPAE
ncbi:hypothetical protein [Mesorhizobium comanense]|uniref:hypothetical protein n=1 Tax=Mesorhizobium comanense TaxID=2502215 RepID=UPI001485B77B|nr:hypothetical protein [Mesorhizobium comanense]